MKTTKNIFRLFLLSLVFVACNAEDPASLDADLHPIDEETPEESAGTFTANIDGAPYEIEIATAIVEDGVITITGKRGNETITLRMPSNIAPNSVTNPYVLGGAEATYAGFYNTTPGANGDLADVSEATTRNNLQVTFDDNVWTTDAATANIFGGTTTIKSLKSAHVNTGNVDGNGNPIFIDVTQEVRMDVQTSVSGAFQFGATNVAYYSAGGAGGDKFEADMIIDNGNITLDIDTVNKLISGTFNFDGTETYTSNASPLVGADTDGDGMLDGVYGLEGTEVGLGYNPNNPCSPIMPAGYTGYDATNTTWLAADCDGDGTSNEDELTAGTDPYEGNIDADGDGVSDAQEGLDGTDAADACDPSQVEFYTNYESTNPTWAAGDCDSDTVINADELANGTNPYFMDYLTKTFGSGEFTYVPYTDIAGPTAKRGLNVSTHNIANKHITGTYNFISASVGEDPTRWYLITGGTFDVTYSVPE